MSHNNSLSSALSAYAQRIVGAKGEPGIQGTAGAAGATAASPLTIKTINESAVVAYTLIVTDADATFLDTNNASANTVTIPPNSSVAIAIGSQLLGSQKGVGATTLVAGSGVTLLTASAGLKLVSQYSVWTAVQVALNVWRVTGDLEA